MSLSKEYFEIELARKASCNFSNISVEDRKALSEALKSCEYRNLTELAVVGNSADDEVVKALSEGLKNGKYPKLGPLQLYDNYDISNEGAEALSEALKSGKCSNLTFLSVDKTSIGDEGVKALSEALKSGKCPNFTELCVSDFGIEGAKALAEALRSDQCSSFTKLRFLGGIDGSIQALCEVLKSGECSNLTHITIGCYTDIEDRKALCEALESGKLRNLTVLDFCHEIPIPYESRKALGEKLRVNIINRIQYILAHDSRWLTRSDRPDFVNDQQELSNYWDEYRARVIKLHKIVGNKVDLIIGDSSTCPPIMIHHPMMETVSGFLDHDSRKNLVKASFKSASGISDIGIESTLHNVRITGHLEEGRLV